MTTAHYFEIDGETLVCDWNEMTTEEAIVLKRFLGVVVNEWLNMVREGDPEAIQFFVWLGLRQNGREVGKPEGINVPLFQLDIRPVDDGAAVADEVDPTSAVVEEVMT